jgi:hypothetical protein
MCLGDAMRFVRATLGVLVLSYTAAMAEPVPLTNVGPDHPLIGEWAGQATSEGASAGVAFRFERQDDGKRVAFFSLPQTNIVDAKIGAVKQDEGIFRVYDFHMRLAPSGTPMTGHLSPAVRGDRVYFGSRDRLVYALDANTGTLRWKRATGDVVNSSPAGAWTAASTLSRSRHCRNPQTAGPAATPHNAPAAPGRPCGCD